MAKLRPYLAQVRVGYEAANDFEAEATAERFVSRIEEDLEEDDTARVTQVVCIGEALREDEVINRLRIARNELATLHYKDTMDIAQLVDQVIWKLLQLAGEDEALPNDYDYNRIIRIKKALDRGEYPLY